MPSEAESPTSGVGPSGTLGILLISGGHERAQYAFLLASAAAAIGRRVVLFATNEGCRALLDDMTGFAAADAALAARGVAGLVDLREAGTELGVRMIACETGLRIAGISDRLAKDVEVAGIVTFLEAVRGGQVISL